LRPPYPVFARLANPIRGPGKENLVQTIPLLFMLPMTQKHRFWLLALVIAVLALNSCANQEGVAPAQGEVTRPGGGY